MKKLIAFALLLVSHCTWAQVQCDTVYVSDKQTSYVVLPFEVDLIDIPSSEYVSSIDGKTVLIKAKKNGAEASTFLIKCGDNYYSGKVIYKETLSKYFYDFRNYTIATTTTTEVKTEVKIEKTPAELDTLKIIHRERMSSVKSLPNKIKTLGGMQDNVYLGCMLIMHDETATYIKLKLSNYSNVNYIIENTTFEITESGGTILRNEVKAVHEDVPRAVASKDDQYLVYCLPLIGIPDNAEVKVTLRERNGLRTITLLIPAKIISSAPIFK